MAAEMETQPAPPSRLREWAVRRVALRQATVILMALAGTTRAASDDPFADLAAAPRGVTNAVVLRAPSWSDNLLLRREVYLLFAAGRDDFERTHEIMSRHSAGFELQKRFATATRTAASFDYQGRVVYRDHELDTAADPMGREASTWSYETHNAYLDLYSLFGDPGRYNLRVGYFYPPFGLNQQSDTHGTLLQLSNDLILGAERDGQMTLYGALNDTLDYTVGYLLGAGPDREFDGQAGLGVLRLTLNNDWLYRHGLEGGVSGAAGERVDAHAAMRLQPAGADSMAAMRADAVVRTWRVGADLRKRFDSAAGPFTLTTELATGEDETSPLWAALTQADWLHPGRRWGAALQFRHFRQDVDAGAERFVDTRATGVASYYFRNDVGNANLHGFALGLERQVQPDDGPEETLIMVQYYRYW